MVLALWTVTILYLPMLEKKSKPKNQKKQNQIESLKKKKIIKTKNNFKKIQK